jgi:hypothetical protein
MARGPKPVAVALAEEECEALPHPLRRRGADQGAVVRARIVLAADAEPEAANRVIAERLKVSRQIVITWRQSFLAHRLDGLESVTGLAGWSFRR